VSNLQKDIDDLDRMVDTGAAKDAIRSQVRFIAREVAALEADYSSLAEQYAALQQSQSSPAAQPAEDLAHIRGLFYASGDPVPFCPRCWEAARRRIHLAGPIPMFNPEIEHWECHTCNAGYSAEPNQTFLPVSRRRAQKA
jgi:hypothetical protein